MNMNFKHLILGITLATSMFADVNLNGEIRNKEYDYPYARITFHPNPAQGQVNPNPAQGQANPDQVVQILTFRCDNNGFLMNKEGEYIYVDDCYIDYNGLRHATYTPNRVGCRDISPLALLKQRCCEAWEYVTTGSIKSLRAKLYDYRIPVGYEHVANGYRIDRGDGHLVYANKNGIVVGDNPENNPLLTQENGIFYCTDVYGNQRKVDIPAVENNNNLLGFIRQIIRN